MIFASNLRERLTANTRQLLQVGKPIQGDASPMHWLAFA